MFCFVLLVLMPDDPFLHVCWRQFSTFCLPSLFWGSCCSCCCLEGMFVGEFCCICFQLFFGVAKKKKKGIKSSVPEPCHDFVTLHAAKPLFTKLFLCSTQPLCERAGPMPTISFDGLRYTKVIYYYHHFIIIQCEDDQVPG